MSGMNLKSPDKYWTDVSIIIGLAKKLEQYQDEYVSEIIMSGPNWEVYRVAYTYEDIVTYIRDGKLIKKNFGEHHPRVFKFDKKELTKIISEYALLPEILNNIEYDSDEFFWAIALPQHQIFIPLTPKEGPILFQRRKDAIKKMEDDEDIYN